MISNYNLDCDYHNFELKDKIYLIPQWALKVIYTDGFNEVVFSGNSANVTILEGYDISFQEETSFDERFKFSKSVSIKVNDYKTFNDLDYRYCVVLETKEGEFYLVNVDFPSFVTHTYTLNNGTNSTELVFSSQSNIATLKLTNFEPNNVNLCKEYSIPKIKNVKLTEAWASYLSTWQKSLVNKGEFVDIEPLPDSISLTEEFDGEKYTVTLGFDIPMSYYKNDWHIKLLQFTENKYRGYISLEDGNKAFVGYNVGLFPSYTINGDIISIRLTETAIRGIAYGNDYALVDTDMPNSIEFNGASCYTYNFESSCNWEVEEKPDYITITPTSGLADTQYELTICNTDDETGYAVSEFIIKSCNAVVRPEVVIKNPIYRYTATTDTTCVEEKYFTLVALEDGAFSISKGINYSINYSKDSGATWSTLYRGGTVSVNSGDTVIWKKNLMKTDWNGTFSASCRFNVEGNIMSLVYGDNFADKTDLTDYDGCLYYLFSGCTNVINASGLTLPATTLERSCYSHMFEDCTSLETAPSVLPATTLAVTCYSGMFNGCTSLTTVPELPATTLADSCYDSMFQNCTSLTTVPELPATTLAEGCYGFMFYGCTSLTTAPELPATTLAKYCYISMFNGCTSLSAITCLATDISADSCTSNWTLNVNYSGKFYKNPNMTGWTTGVDGIPSGWQIIDYQS